MDQKKVAFPLKPLIIHYKIMKFHQIGWKYSMPSIEFIICKILQQNDYNK
jgi:hypothetical protein